MLASQCGGRGLYLIATLLILLASLAAFSQSPWYRDYVSRFPHKGSQGFSEPSLAPPATLEPSPPKLTAVEPSALPTSPESPLAEGEEEGEETDGGDYWIWPDYPRFHRSSLINLTADTLDLCAAFPTHLLSTVQIVLKIGASEPSDRLNAQLSSVTKCITNLPIASDLDYMLGPHRAFDVLADLPPSLQHDNPDFEAYRSQKELFANGSYSNKEGWRLDKYKFLPMVEYAYQSNPSARWFVFLEADTFIIWDNLFQLLDNYDYSIPLYFGSPAPGRTPPGASDKTWFAYGGPGFVISAAAVDKLLSRATGSYGHLSEPRINTQYEQILRGDCCGDSVLGYALWEKGVTLSGLFPMFNPHPLQGVPFGDRFWCEPAISMHMKFSQAMVPLWEWTQNWKQDRPILWVDLLDYLGLGSLKTHDDWDNADWDGFEDENESPAHSSFDACGSACHNHRSCFQYTYHHGRCRFVRSIRLGQRRVAEGRGTAQERRFFAGWDSEKIIKWVNSHPCDGAHWVKPSLKRIF